METLERQTRKTLRATVVWPALASFLIFLGLALVGGQALETAADLRDLNEQRRLSLRIERRLFAAERELQVQNTAEAKVALGGAADLAGVVIGYLSARMDRSDEKEHWQLLQNLRADLNRVRLQAEEFRSLPDGELADETPGFLVDVQDRIFQMEEVDRELHAYLTGRLEWNFRLIVGLLIALTISFVVVIPLFTVARVQALGVRFQELIEQAKAASRSKSSFLANMSHEIRTPISAIIGYTDILSNRVVEPDDQSILRVISSNADHLLQLVNDILDFSKIESLAMTVRKAPLVLEKFVAELVSMNAARAELAGVHLVADVPPLLPEVVFTDELRLRQVILNLLTNAIKISPEGGTVTLSFAIVSFQEQPGPGAQGPQVKDQDSNGSGWLRVEVRDQGPGVPLAQQETIFDAFTQGEQSDARKHQGTGLGLTISRRLTQLLGGRIGLQSEPGQGAMFWIEVPCYDNRTTKMVDIRVCDRRRRQVQIPKRILKGYTGLVVDDRTDIRLMIEQFCAEAGSEVISARDGFEALRKAGSSQKPFDYVVLDIQMPGKDGFEVMRDLVAAGHTCPVLALTASASTAVQQKCLEAGFAAFLGKPVERGRLLDTIAHMLEPVAVGGPVGSPIRVLLVEDDRVVAEMIRRLLSRHSFVGQVDCLLPGEVEHLLERGAPAPDVVLIDHGLGAGVQADQVIRQLRERFSRVGIVGMSADPLRELDPRFEEAVDGFIEKSDLPSVAHVIQRVVNALQRCDRTDGVHVAAPAGAAT
jgi:signal transduction histidine kinase/CheY-like chemotaxis protein